jgi:dTDP-4-dehydrorhamnose reductase
MIIGERGFIGRNLAYRVKRDHVCINAAGRKDIVWCESHSLQAFADNAIMPATKAKDAQFYGVPFVHIGSDHSYTGKPEWNTVYARSKRLGDDLVLRENPKSSVIVTGHVYSKDCPWVRWLDGQLRAGLTVTAYTNRICCPTWIGDLADACEDIAPGLRIVVGNDRVDRVVLYRTYAEVFGYDPSLIVPGLESNPLLVGDSSLSSDVKTCGIREGFELMKAGL